MFLLILDSLGGSELLVILVVALIIFGPRKLPQLSRSLGRSLADFKRASQDFKETWEKEASLSDNLKEARIERAMLPEESQTIGATVGRGSPFSATRPDAPVAPDQQGTPVAIDAVSASLVPPPSIRPIPADPSMVQSSSSSSGDSNGAPVITTTAEPRAAVPEPTQKRDWL